LPTYKRGWELDGLTSSRQKRSLCWFVPQGQIVLAPQPLFGQKKARCLSTSGQGSGYLGVRYGDFTQPRIENDSHKRWFLFSL